MPSHLRRYDEAGHTHFWTVSCYRRLTFFYHDAMKQVVVDGLHMLQRRFGVCLIAYVIMPEHLHLLVFPHVKGDNTPIPVSTLWHAFKQHVGYHGKRCLREFWRRDRRLWSEPLNAWAHGMFDKQSILHTRGYDFNIDHHETLLQKIDSCHRNPVTRGLVDHPDEWRWSSYRYLELDDGSVLEMDWNGAWPILW